MRDRRFLWSLKISMGKKCKNCGTPLAKNSKFCIQCGQPVSASARKNKSDKKPCKKLPTGVCIFLTCLCCIAIVLLGSVASIGLSARYLTSPDKIRATIDKLDIGNIKTGFLSGNSRKEKIPDLIYTALPYYLHYHFDEDNIETLLNEDFTKEFISIQISQYIEDIFKETGDGLIEIDELEEFFEENEDAIQDILEFEFPNWAYVDMLDDLDANDLEKITDLSEYRDEHRAIFNTIRFGLSYPVLIICTLLSFALIVMIFRINGLKPASFISTSICSGIVAIVHIISTIMVAIIQPKLEDEMPFGSDLYDTLLSPVKNHELIIGLIFLVIFICILSLGILMKNKTTKKQKEA